MTAQSMNDSPPITTPRKNPIKALLCDACGQLPHPSKARLTLANVTAMLPIELLVHAAVVNAALPYVLKVLVLTLTATVLVIWVAEPSVRRALRGWLHAPALRHRRRLNNSAALQRSPGETGRGHLRRRRRDPRVPESHRCRRDAGRAGRLHARSCHPRGTTRCGRGRRRTGCPSVAGDSPDRGGRPDQGPCPCPAGRGGPRRTPTRGRRTARRQARRGSHHRQHLTRDQQTGM